MDKNEIKSKLVDMLAELFPDSGVDKDVLDYADLMDDLGMDSVTFITLVVEIETCFGVTIPDNMLLMERFNNADSIVNIIDNILNG